LSFVGGPLSAAPQWALKVPVAQADKLQPQAALVAALLTKGGSVYFRQDANVPAARDAQGRWQAGALQAALRSQGPLVLSGDTEGAAAGLNVDLGPVSGKSGPWISTQGLPEVTLIQDSSTVSPLSKGLDSWKWPYRAVSFADVEADPRGVLDLSHCDLIIFSSPGWWDDFANPPGGPSRLPKKVAEALQNFVRQGGSALFIDIAQWDLERTWPKTLSLDPLGPYKVSQLKLAGSVSGGVSLAPVGVATDRLRSKEAFGLLGSDSFAFPDGGTRPLYAAYAMPDPSGGQGWVAGLALHVFEQDESLAPRIRRLFLNLLLLSGQRRLSAPAEPAVAAPPTAPTPAPTFAPVPTTIPSPMPTAKPPLPVPFVTAATLPTPFPTQVIRAIPSPGPLPTMIPPTPWPSPSAVRVSAAKALPTPTVVPARVPTVLAVVRSVRLPTPLPTRALPSSVPSPARFQATPAPSPLATAGPGVEIKAGDGVKNALGCMASAPEPFAEGGVYLQFCLRHSAKVQVTVFDAKGHALWHSAAASLGAGNHQVFFDGRVGGRAIVPGRYLWEARAEDESGRAESRQESLTRRGKTGHR
jgi:hypothetical protein